MALIMRPWRCWRRDDGHASHVLDCCADGRCAVWTVQEAFHGVCVPSEKSGTWTVRKSCTLIVSSLRESLNHHLCLPCVTLLYEWDGFKFAQLRGE